MGIAEVALRRDFGVVAAMARVPTPTEPLSLPQTPPLGPRTLLTAEFAMGATVQVVLLA